MNGVKYEGRLNGRYHGLIGIETETGAVRNKFNILYGTLIYVAAGTVKGQSRVLHITRGRKLLILRMLVKNDRKRFRR